MKVELLKFRKFSKNTLQGFADFLITPPGIEVRDCPVHEKEGRRWVNFPAQEFEGRDGTKSWAPYVKFPDRDDYQIFNKAAVEALAAEVTNPEKKADDIPF